MKKPVRYCFAAILFSSIISGYAAGTVPVVMGDDQVIAITEGGREQYVQLSVCGQIASTKINPLRIEICGCNNTIVPLSGTYSDTKKSTNSLIATGEIGYGPARFIFTDKYKVEDDRVVVERRLRVSGSADGGFASLLGFEIPSGDISRDELCYFAPGNIYGNGENLPENAFGKDLSLDNLFIREDRLPAPMFGVRFTDNTSISHTK